MKKTLVRIALGASLIFGGTALAQNVGEPMPKPEGTVYRQGPMGDKMYMRMYHKFGVPEANEVHGVCNGQINKIPFGHYAVGKDTLYLDNAPTDGLIDEVVVDPRSKGRIPRTDRPTCPQ